MVTARTDAPDYNETDLVMLVSHSQSEILTVPISTIQLRLAHDGCW